MLIVSEIINIVVNWYSHRYLLQLCIDVTSVLQYYCSCVFATAVYLIQLHILHKCMTWNPIWLKLHLMM